MDFGPSSYGFLFLILVLTVIVVIKYDD